MNTINNGRGGNIYNKYKSKNPLVKKLMKDYFYSLDNMICPIRSEIVSAIEIGCGEGYVTKHIKDMGIEIEGADIEEGIIDIARILNPSINFGIKSIYELSNYNKYYDLVLATEVLEHLDDPGRGLKEMIKVSNKYVFLSVPNDTLFRLANILRLKYLRELGNTPGHLNHWSKNSFKIFLDRCGMKVINIKNSTLWIMALCEKGRHITPDSHLKE